MLGTCVAYPCLIDANQRLGAGEKRCHREWTLVSKAFDEIRNDLRGLAATATLRGFNRVPTHLLQSLSFLGKTGNGRGRKIDPRLRGDGFERFLEDRMFGQKIGATLVAGLGGAIINRLTRTA